MNKSTLAQALTGENWSPTPLLTALSGIKASTKDTPEEKAMAKAQGKHMREKAKDPLKKLFNDLAKSYPVAVMNLRL